MNKLVPFLMIVALAGCTDGAGIFNRSGGAAAPDPGAGAGETAAGESEEGAEAAPAETPEETAAAEPEPRRRTETVGDPFDEPRTPATEPAEPEPRVAATEEPAAPQPAADGRLGTTTASLGDPNEPGFWLKTPLVSATQMGRVVYVQSGRSVQVQLIPAGSAGGGSQISIAAMRLLEAPLTGLPELVVYAN